MKKIIKKFASKVSGILITVSALTAISTQSAIAAPAAAAPTIPEGIGSNITNTIISVYNNMLAAYADAAYQFDSQVEMAMNNNQAIVGALPNINKALKDYVDVATGIAFAGIQAQNKMDAAATNVKAGDDIDLNTNAKDINMFGGIEELSKELRNAEALNNNYMFNVENLLGLDVYSDTTSKSNAMAYLKQIETIAPPPQVIRMGATFQVPVSNSNDPTQTTAFIGQKTPLTSSELEKLREDVQSDSTYRTYKKNYRALVALRNVYLDNLFYSYQIRLPQANSKSFEQMRDEQAASRLTADYYKKMSTASPDTVNREMLFVLAEIRNELNEIRKQNERIIVMNSISNLNSIAGNVQSINANMPQIGNIVYCKAPGNEEDPICTSSNSNNEITEMTTTTTPADTSPAATSTTTTTGQ